MSIAFKGVQLPLTSISGLGAITIYEDCLAAMRGLAGLAHASTRRHAPSRSWPWHSSRSYAAMAQRDAGLQLPLDNRHAQRAPQQNQPQQPQPQQQQQQQQPPQALQQGFSVVPASPPRASTGFKKTFYKRKLPCPPAIEFSSPEGRQLFQEALLEGSMVGFFKLMEQFKSCPPPASADTRTQDEPAFCGLASLAMVLNALSIDPRRTWKGSWRWFHEAMLDCCRPLDVVKEEGITLYQASCLARCNGARVALRPYGSTTLEAFREEVAAVCASGEEHVVVSYSRKAFLQTGDGHFSPIGGYHRGRDLVLVLDVARFKYPPHWVPLPMLYHAMSYTDPETGRPRGYMRLASNPLLDSVLLTLDVRSDGLWQAADRFVRGEAPGLVQKLAAQGGLSGEDVVRRVVDAMPLASLDAFLIVRSGAPAAVPAASPAAVAVATAAVAAAEQGTKVGGTVAAASAAAAAASKLVADAAAAAVSCGTPEAMAAAVQRASEVGSAAAADAAAAAASAFAPSTSASFQGTDVTHSCCGGGGGDGDVTAKPLTATATAAARPGLEGGKGPGQGTNSCTSGAAVGAGTGAKSCGHGTPCGSAAAGAGGGGVCGTSTRGSTSTSTSVMAAAAAVFTAHDRCIPLAQRQQLLDELRGMPLYALVANHLAQSNTAATRTAEHTSPTDAATAAVTQPSPPPPSPPCSTAPPLSYISSQTPPPPLLPPPPVPGRYLVEKVVMALLVLPPEVWPAAEAWADPGAGAQWRTLLGLTGHSVVDAEASYLREQLMHIDEVLQSGDINGTCGEHSSRLDCAAHGH